MRISFKYRAVCVGLLLLCPFGAMAQVWKQALDSGLIENERKNFKAAASHLLRARDLLQTDSLYTISYIKTVRALADIMLLRENDGARAAPLYEELRPVIRQVLSERTKDYADACHYLGVIYHNGGKLDTARILYTRSMEIRKELFGEASAPFAQSCNNLGSLYRDLGDFEQAEPHLLKAVQIRKELSPAGRLPVYAISCTALANLYRDMGKFEQAESLYIIARKVRADTLTRSHPLYAYSCNILADLYSYAYMGLFEKAEKLYLEAMALRAAAGKDSYEYAETCANLGALYRDNGQLDKAEPLLLEAKSILERKSTGGSPSYTILLNNLGELYTASGKYDLANAYLMKARQSWEKELGKEHPFYSSNGETLSRLFWAAGQREKADSLIRETAALKYRQVNRVFQFTSETEKNLYLDNINGAGQSYYSFYFSQFPHDQASFPYDLSLWYRNLILSSLQQTRQGILTAGNPQLVASYLGWTTAKEKLARIYTRGALSDSFQIQSLEHHADSLEKELSRLSGVFRKSREPAGWRQIREKLVPGEASIEFITFQLYNGKNWTDSVFYAALLLNQSLAEPVFVPLFEKRQLDKLFQNRKTLSPEFIRSLYLGTSLYRLIWEPLEKYLTGIQRVYFAPSGYLHTLAFRAFKTTDDRQLADKYELVQLLSTGTIADEAPTTVSAKDRMVLYGDIKYLADSSALVKAALKYKKDGLASRSIPDLSTELPGFVFFEPLAYSGKEIDSIAAFARRDNSPVWSYRGVDANEESFKSLSEDTSAFLLHLSTHGFFYPDPRAGKRLAKDPVARPFKVLNDPLFRGGLVLAGAENSWRGKAVQGTEDGILTAYEVSLQNFPNNKLTVLSACRSALGDIGGNEGVYGLQRAFKIAGTKNLVMSLWDVPDLQAEEFMEQFYRGLFQQRSIDQAFDKAYAYMKEKYRGNPQAWACWILVR